MNKLLIILLLACAGHVLAQNAAEQWEKIPSPPGGWMLVEKNVKGDTVYAQCLADKNENSLYRSIDGGNHWNKLPVLLNNTPIGKNIYIAPSGRFYYTVNDPVTGSKKKYLWVSENEGVTWQLMNQQPLEIENLVETKSGVLFRNTVRTSLDSTYVFRSTDYGSSWNQVLSLPYDVSFNISLVALDRAGSVIVLKTGNNPPNSLITNNNGLTWQTIQNPGFNYKFWAGNSGTLFASNAITLKRSTNGGQSWEVVAFDNLSTAYTPWIKCLMFWSDGKMVALDRNNRLILSSIDDGVTWSILAPYDPEFIDFGIDQPLNNGDLLAYSGSAVYRSEDEGLTWNFSTDGVDHANIMAMEVVNDSTRIVTTEYGIWRTTNGSQWTRISAKKSSFRTGSAKNLTISTVDGQALYSTDWGDSFAEITPPGWQAQGDPVFISKGNPVLFANSANRNGLLRSADQGATWTNVSSQLFATDLKFHPSGRYFAKNDSSGIWFSDDSGLTWAPLQNLPAGITLSVEKQFEIGPTGNLLFLGNRVIDNTEVMLRSTDQGASWTVITVPDAPFTIVDQVLENALGHIYFIAGASFYSSVDEGHSWQKIEDINLNPEWPYVRYLSLDISPGQYLYAGTFAQGLMKSRTSSEQGAYLHGQIKLDADADCSTDDGQPAALNHWIVQTSGEHTYYGTTDSLGRFLMFVDTGHYEVIVRSPNRAWWEFCDTLQSVYLPELLERDTVGFSVFALSYCPLVTVNTAVPTLRRCFDNSVYVQYCNQGTEPADSAWVDVELDPYLSFVGSGQAHADLGNNNIRFFIDTLASGDCGEFQFTVYVDCDSTVLGQTHCITAHGYPDTLCSTIPNWSGANIEADVQCQDSTVTFELRNTGPVGSQTLEYIIIEDDVVMSNGQMNYAPNEVIQLNWPANGHTIRLESEQEPGHPFSYRVLAFEEGCGGFQSLGYINQFSVNGIRPSWHTTCVENTGSYDPNDKHGYPIGTGAEHRIRPGQPIEYMIRFQNTGTDTAFTVVVKDQLSAFLDAASIVPGAASHPYTWQLGGQGELKFTFSNILLPDSTTNLNGSQGFVTFRIDQKPDLPLGTQILNQAAIYFDFNAPVLTNQTWHTIGNFAVSGVLESPVRQQSGAVNTSPNPATDHTVFELKKGIFRGHRIEIFNALGAPVYSTELNAERFILSGRDLPPGAYGWRVTDDKGGFIDSGTLIFL